jgi:hypothetical protein
MFLYCKAEKAEEGYVLVPALFSLSLFTKGTEVIDICICSILVLVYSVLSAFKGKANIYTAVSFLTIVFGLPVLLEADAYIVFVTLGIWSIIHFIMYEKHKEVFKLTGIISILGIYFKTLSEFEIEYYSLYFLGALLGLIAISKLVINKNTPEVTIFEILGFVVITIASLIIVDEAIDAVIMIVVYFLFVIAGFAMKYKTITYSALVAMIVQIIKQTVEFWSSIPIYIYVLLIGLALILFAMFDERLNIKKKKQQNPEKIEEKNNID